MSFKFVRFTETDASFLAKAAIRQTGQLGFTAGAVNRYRIGDFDFAVLYFDAENRVVGIELTKERGEGAIPIKKSKTNTYIRAKNFCDRFEIDYSRSHRYDLRRDDQTGFLYFELDKEDTSSGTADEKEIGGDTEDEPEEDDF